MTETRPSESDMMSPPESACCEGGQMCPPTQWKDAELERDSRRNDCPSCAMWRARAMNEMARQQLAERMMDEMTVEVKTIRAVGAALYEAILRRGEKGADERCELALTQANRHMLGT